MADLEKKILEAPKLPNHIQGDGRYLMSLLKSFLEQTAEQVNLANGFSAEEINPEAGGYPTPRDFFLTFTRLGGEFSWSHVYDVSTLAYYELRVNQEVGNVNGLLERTIDNTSTVLPNNYADTVYLYAVSKEGAVSSPSTLNYNKPRPDTPQDITVTKTSEGALITFLEIPSNCIGANIYIDNKKFVTNDNIFLARDLLELEKVEVAYYDQFGEGERGVIYIILPDVTGFLVERNGASLDFYWDAINIYGVKYIVKVGKNADWNQAVELFRTETNDKNRRLYPNTGEYYLLVKAYDENGNYSKNAAYQIMNTEPDISRNVILEFNQDDILYSGNKINVYYDASVDGVVLDRDAVKGEYIFPVSLKQNYRARNWLEYEALVASNSVLTWDDANFSWDEANFRWGGMNGNADSATFRQEIAFANDSNPARIFDAELKGNLRTEAGEVPFENANADNFLMGRWDLGVQIQPLTKLAYEVPLVTTQFGLTFYLKMTEAMPDTILVTLMDRSDNYLVLGFNAQVQKFYLTGSDGVEIFLPYTAENIIEIFTFGITQTATERRLYVHSYNREQVYSEFAAASPITTFNQLYCYPKVIPS